VRKIFGRADAGFYCWDAVQAYEKHKASFIIVARKTPRLLEELEKAHWSPRRRRMPMNNASSTISPRVGEAYRFIALRYLKKDQTPKPQYQLFDTPKYIYRVFVPT